MQTTSRKTNVNSKKESKDDTAKKQDEKLKRGVHTVSTPRNFVQKSTTADIYAQKKKTSENYAKTPKKVLGTTKTSNESPMKGFLKSSASSVSQISRTDKTAKNNDSKTPVFSARRNETPKKPVLTNVTVNSPVSRRRLDSNTGHVTAKDAGSLKNLDRNKEAGKLSRQASNLSKTKEIPKEAVGQRQRTKTRTLDESEVKILTPDIVDNNTGMINLSQKLIAKSKAFYVELDENKDESKPKKDKSSDEDVSYEDDFESYESDFESYHSDQTNPDETSETSEKSGSSETSEKIERHLEMVDQSSLKEKDEEKMLDSGNFDLRDQRSAKSKPAALDFILEDSEDRKTVSLTDEGFQDMSTSSAGSSLKTQTDRALFIDLAKSKQNKRKRKINERLQQRAKDLLGMITLHEMSYSLFEMQPISYDLYMATFGRSNYTQFGVQTYDDGITEEIQTDEVPVSQKWTQHPVEFSKSDIYINKEVCARKYSKHTEDYLTKFTFMMKSNCDDQDKVSSDENYKANPLRVVLEQKDGVGNDEMLPYENYKSKLKSNDYNSTKLGKFLKKIESRVSHVLCSNIGDTDITNLSKSNKIPFSKGYYSLPTKTEDDEKFLKYLKITHVIFSETKSNLILTVHKNTQNAGLRKSLICLWDLNVAKAEPIKFLTAIDDVVLGKISGNIKGVFVAALSDGSIHLWDLSEEPTWRQDDTNETRPKEIVEIESSKMTEIEKDREWNLKNRNVGCNEPRLAITLHSCAFTSSGLNLSTKDEIDYIVGLEMNSEAGNLDGGRRIVGQVLSLQRVGILTIWSIIQDKQKSSQDIGKAYLSKMKLDKCQTINFINDIDINTKHNLNNEHFISFNLNAAKRRLSLKKKEKSIVKKQYSRPQSAVSSRFDFDIDRPSSAASMRKRMLPTEINLPKSWETGMVCNDLKIMRIDNIDNYLIAKNCGEVLRCKRYLGAMRIERFNVARPTSSVTNIETCKGLPYFLAATNTGTVSLCSVLENRVLLTLDCSESGHEDWLMSTYLVQLKGKPSRVEFAMTRNVPSVHDSDKCMSDSKGRFISSITTRRPSESIEKPLSKLEIKSVHWSAVNPCSVHVLLCDNTLVLFELTHSDIYAKCVCENAAVKSSANDFQLALLTPDGEVQIHRLLANESQTKENCKVFKKYVALL